MSVGLGSGGLASGGLGSGGGMDLLTVITHELGHVLGLPDLDPLRHDDNVMAGYLGQGQRRIGGAVALSDSIELPGAAAGGHVAASDRRFMLLESRDSSSDLLPLSGAKASRSSQTDELLARTVSSGDLDSSSLIEPLLDEQRRRRERLTGLSVADDFFAQLGEDDEL